MANYAEKMSYYNPKTNIISPIDFLSIYTLSYDKSKDIWFAGYSNKVRRYSATTNSITEYTYNKNNPQSLNGNTFYKIFCDRSGTVWIGHNAGVSAYNPYRFKFPILWHIPETPSPISNSFSAIHQFNDTITWFGSSDLGVSTYNTKKGEFNSYQFSKERTNSISSNNVKAITSDNYGNIWFSLWDGNKSAVNKFNQKTKQFTRFTTPDSYYWYSDIVCNKKGDIYASSWGTGIRVFDQKACRFLSGYISGVVDLRNPEYLFSQIDSLGKVWVYDQHPSYFDPSTKNTTIHFSKFINDSRLLFRKPKDAIDVNIPINHSPKSPFISKSGECWILYPEDYLINYTNEISLFHTYRLPQGKYYCITDASVENEFWLGGDGLIVHFSKKNGSCEIIYKDDKIGEIKSIIDFDNSLYIGSNKGFFKANKSVNGINNVHFIDSLCPKQIIRYDDKLYLRTDNGLFIYSLSNNLTTQFETKHDKLNDDVLCMSLKRNELWFGTSNGIICYNINSKTIKRYLPNPKDSTGLISSKIHSISVSKEGKVWITGDKGFSVLDTIDSKFKNYLFLNRNSLTSYLILCLLSDSQGNLWAGSSNGYGIDKINPKTNTINHYIPLSYDSTSFRGGDVFSIFESHDKTIWVGTSLGLAMLVNGTKSFKYYGIKDGFQNENIYAIEEDSKNNLWLSNGAGITKFNPKSGLVNNYTWYDGLQEDVFNMHCSEKFNDGRIAFGGEAGLNVFSPDNIKNNPYNPLPLIVSIKINDDIRYLTNPDTLINLDYKDRNIEFSFSSSDYQFPQKNILYYQLVLS